MEPQTAISPALKKQTVCAMIYVFDDDEEMGECCGCPLSSARLKTFSVNANLTSNWGLRGGPEGGEHDNGAIAVVASSPNTVGVLIGGSTFSNPGGGGRAGLCLGTACCDPTNAPGYSVTTTASLLASITHNQIVQFGPTTSIEGFTQITETALFDDASGDPTNLVYLQSQCGALIGNGSGGGVCDCSVRPLIPLITPTPTATATGSATPTATSTATSTGTATPTPTATSTPAGKLVFVTSSGFFGNLGGTAGGDTDCNNAASAAGLSGTYKAWLSTAATGDNPASSFTQSTIPYVLVDNTQVAANWTALVSGTLDHAINEDEHGTITTQSFVWTGTNANGTAPTYPQQSLDCFGWSDQTDLAYVGSPAATNSTWSLQEGVVCNNLVPLYCFQQ